MLAGRLKTGGVVSVAVRFTVTVKLPVAVLPARSLDEQVTVVAPTIKFTPEAGVQLTGRDPETVSLAVAV